MLASQVCLPFSKLLLALWPLIALSKYPLSCAVLVCPQMARTRETTRKSTRGPPRQVQLPLEVHVLQEQEVPTPEEVPAQEEPMQPEEAPHGHGDRGGG
jgi:hypothetical protein